MKRFKNFGYSRLATARKTDAGAHPPGFTTFGKMCFITVEEYCIIRWKQQKVISILTIGYISYFTEDIVSADLFVALWWTDERLADHGHIDFGTDTPACGLENKVGSWYIKSTKQFAIRVGIIKGQYFYNTNEIGCNK